MSDDLRLLSAGAAQGVVEAMREPFRAATGATIDATFGAVGALAARFADGETCDAVILTATMIADLERRAQLLPGTSAPLGRVRTGVAVRSGDPQPGIADRAQLAAAFRAAPAIYVPDTTKSTAGTHMADVFRRLGLGDELAPRLSIHPNGATAMRALASSTQRGAIGCTQITEIRFIPGVVLVGALPAEFELATVYSVAVAGAAPHPQLGRQFAEMISASSRRALREERGFESE